jgi:N-acetylglucosamine-6-phosphate deacetylase
MGEALLLTNGKIVTPLRRIEGGTILIEGGTIKDLGPSDRIVTPEGAQVIDVRGMWISPGFIDLHLHGSWDGDVMAATPGDLARMAEGLVRGGVTSFVPSTLSGPLPAIVRAVECVEGTMGKGMRGAKILGVHVEGPYFSMEQKGAQNPEYIIPPRPEDYLPVLDQHPSIIRVSAAPEISGALELGQELRRRGIVASIGHSNATYQEVIRAVENGYTHATHIFSAMSTVRRIEAYRVSGVVEAVLVIDELTTEMIADGHHLPPSLMKLVLKCKGMDKVCLVTDAMVAAGLGPGKYVLGGLDVIVESSIPGVFELPAEEGNYVAKLADRSAFASSVATMDQILRVAVRHLGLSVSDAVRLISLNPARMQRIDRERGLLAPGMKADITVFDDDLRIHLTLVEGKIEYRETSFL